MSFMHPRTIAVRRPPSARTRGVAAYGGVTREAETEILAGLPASIQYRATAGQTGAQLPSDTRAAAAWRIFIPRRALSDPEAIKHRDTVEDDLGRRFQVFGAYPSSMDFVLHCEQLEV